MADEVDDPVAQAHGELALARAALTDGDLEHAAGHLAGAIAWAPGLPEVHELLAALTVRAGAGAAELFGLREPVFVGTVVAHAHVIASRDPLGALRMLAQATGFDPEQPWADVSWVRALDPAALDPDELARLFVTVMQRLGDPAPETVTAANEVYLDLARRALAVHHGHALLHGAAAGLARRFGATADAVRWGRRGHRLHPDKLTSVWYAYALRADGRLDAALKVMRAAWKAAPQEMDLCADMANWLAESGRVDEAIALLEEGMRRQSDYDCAVHTVHRLRFRRDGDVTHLIGLVDYMREHPLVSHEHTDLAQACERRTWLGRVAGPAEACVDTLRRIPVDRRADMDGRMTLSALEVPSAMALLRRELPGVRLEVTTPAPPGMTQPLKTVRALWRYDQHTAYPTVEPAAPASRQLLQQLTTPAWAHPIAAYDSALLLGELPAEELLSLLVHPPARPERYASLPDGWWERSAQVFACLGILHCSALRNPADPGDTTGQRQLLTAIAWGVEDWTTDAALYALTVAAWLDPNCRVEVCDTVGRRFLAAVRASRERVVTIRESLVALVRIVPDMVPDVLALADEVERARPAPAVVRAWGPSLRDRLFRKGRGE